MQSNFSNLISREEDRVFIIDRRCYLFCSGDGFDDPRPFIRIGSVGTLPPECRGLIDTVIIPAVPLGNPLAEPMNRPSGTRDFPRYIGSKQALARFVSFQKSIGNPIDPAMLTKVENDLPLFGKNAQPADRNRFIGLFTGDGNFIIRHDQDRLFDLAQTRKSFTLASSSHSLKRILVGTGILASRDGIFFYADGALYGMHLPSNTGSFTTLFSSLDTPIRGAYDVPGRKEQLEELISAASETGDPLVVSSDNPHLKPLTGYLNAGNITLRPAQAGEFTGTDWKISRSGETSWLLNLIRGKEEITVACLGEAHLSIRKNSDPDFLVTTAELFSRSAVFFRSLDKPLVVIAGIDHAAQVRTMETTVIWREIPCRLEIEPDTDIILASINLEEEILHSLYTGNSNDCLSALDNLRLNSTEFEHALRLYNLIGLCRFLMKTSTSREILAELKTIYSAVFPLSRIEPFFAKPGLIVTKIFINGDALCEQVSAVPFADAGFISGSHLEARISRDRERLEQFIAGYRSIHAEVSETVPVPFTGKTRPEASVPLVKQKISRPVPKKYPVIIALAILLAASVVALIYRFGSSNSNTDITAVESQDSAANRKNEPIVVEKRPVSDNEIFQYAKKVAAKNGYGPIEIRTVKEKNPHWIFPGSRFTMLDGQVITVKPGDTLWNICRDKLENSAPQKEGANE